MQDAFIKLVLKFGPIAQLVRATGHNQAQASLNARIQASRAQIAPRAQIGRFAWREAPPSKKAELARSIIGRRTGCQFIISIHIWTNSSVG